MSRDVSHRSAVMRSSAPASAVHERRRRRRALERQRGRADDLVGPHGVAGRTVRVRRLSTSTNSASLSAPDRRRSGGNAASATLSSGSDARRVSIATSSTTAAARAAYIRTCQV